MRFSEGERSVVDGPFGEKDAIAGYWVLRCGRWRKRLSGPDVYPFEALARIYPGEYGAEGEVEIRQVFEMEGLETSSRP